MLDFNLRDVISFLETQSPQSKLYIGCDSSCFKKNDEWYAEYVSVVVIHKNSKNGCKIFGRREYERDYGKKLNIPRLRLMNEVYKATNLYQELSPYIGTRSCEIHLDINSDPKYNSSIILKEAIGYVKGITGLEPKIKPLSFASTCAADRHRWFGCFVEYPAWGMLYHKNGFRGIRDHTAFTIRDDKWKKVENKKN